MSIVYLIDAGPGSPGLITVRGMECLAAADVVLYDHLVQPGLLRHARPDSEKIDLGAGAPQPLAHEAICYLLLEKAREGRSVARLKCEAGALDHGDAEALFLHEQGVPFEVVPGVPTPIGAASHAGIPLTYPGSGDPVTFVRVYDDPDRPGASIDWARLAGLQGTLVCYAPPRGVPAIANELLSRGRAADEPAALVCDGTLPTQTTVAGTLGDIGAAAESSASGRTSVLFVGRAVALRDHLRWFDARPLFGRRVLVTRPKDQGADFGRLLESLGAEAIEAPMTRILPPEDFAPLDAACARIRDFDWVVFTSVNAVDPFVDRLLASHLDLRALGAAKLCAIGQSTAERLRERGLKADLVPGESRAEAIVQAIAESGEVSGLRVLFPRADIARAALPDELRKRGAEVTDVVAYRTVVAEPEREGEPDIYRLLLERRIDVVTFASPSAVKSMVSTLGAEPAADLLNATLVACIGPVTAEAAAQYGIQTAIMPAQYSIPALADAIVRHFSAAQPPQSPAAAGP